MKSLAKLLKPYDALDLIDLYTYIALIYHEKHGLRVTSDNIESSIKLALSCLLIEATLQSNGSVLLYDLGKNLAIDNYYDGIRNIFTLLKILREHLDLHDHLKFNETYCFVNLATYAMCVAMYPLSIYESEIVIHHLNRVKDKFDSVVGKVKECGDALKGEEK